MEFGPMAKQRHGIRAEGPDNCHGIRAEGPDNCYGTRAKGPAIYLAQPIGLGT